MKFEIVQTDAGWHARMKGGNEEIVWTTEVYTRRETAEEAILTVKVAFARLAMTRTEPTLIDIDERTKS